MERLQNMTDKCNCFETTIDPCANWSAESRLINMALHEINDYPPQEVNRPVDIIMKNVTPNMFINPLNAQIFELIKKHYQQGNELRGGQMQVVLSKKQNSHYVQDCDLKCFGDLNIGYCIGVIRTQHINRGGKLNAF
ncbi:MAG: hypothetical protein WCQ99_09180 [Pseudomonadota bacterium]